MTLVLRVPPSYEPERAYVGDVVLRQFLGVEYAIEAGDVRATEVRLEGDAEGRLLVLRDGIFQTSGSDWLEPQSLPSGPLPRWAVPSALAGGVGMGGLQVPVMFGSPLVDGTWCHLEPRRIEIGVDLLGGAFFLLSRYEEIVSEARDRHGRFPASASLAVREDFIDRPLVDEYVEILWAALHQLWPRLERASQQYHVHLTHDVDRVSCSRMSVPGTLRAAAVDAVLRGDPVLAGRRLAAAARVRLGHADADLCNTFDWLMDQSERFGLRSAFYFLAGRTDPRFDGDYALDDASIRRLLRRISERGHEVGLHASYGSMRSPEIVLREFQALRRAAEAEGVRQAVWGGRQHYLRWEVPATWQAWEDAGLHYDCTVGFASRTGFRAGTCRRFEVFNLRARRALRLEERPLIAMEVSLLAPEYMGLTRAEALEELRGLSSRCRESGGEFVLLWHNSSVVAGRDQALYRDVLEGLCARS
jgi:hypothetical protein